MTPSPWSLDPHDPPSPLHGASLALTPVPARLFRTQVKRAYDNVNSHGGNEARRIYDEEIVTDATAGVAMLPHAPVALLSTRVPEFVHPQRRTSSTRLQLVAEYDHAASSSPTEAQVAAAVSAATADGWVAMANVSDIPSEIYTLEKGSFAWSQGALPADAGLGARLRVEGLAAKIQMQMRSYQRRVNEAQGTPMLRLLGAPADLVASGALAAALQAQVELTQVCSLFRVPVAATARLELEPGVPLPTGVAVPWEPARWKTLARAMTDDLWNCVDEIDQVDLLSPPCAAGPSSPPATPAATNSAHEWVVVAITSEPEVVLGAMHGGAGADAELRHTKRGVGSYIPAPFKPEEQWRMPLPPPSRLRAVLDEFPEAARQSILEPLPTVMANSCSHEGMCQVIMNDVRVWDLPYARIFDLRRKGFDNGVQILAGDQLTLCRHEGVESLLATSIIASFSELQSLDPTDKSFYDVLDTTLATIDIYKQMKAYALKCGPLHYAMHGTKVLATLGMPFIYATTRTLLGIKGIDVSVSNFESWGSYRQTLEGAQFHALFDEMRLQGKYPNIADVRREPAEELHGRLAGRILISPSAALECVGKFVQQGIASGDVVTIATAALVRLLHELERFEASIEIDDETYVRRCSYPFFLPPFRVHDKVHYTRLSAAEMSKHYVSSARMRKSHRQLFSHAEKGCNKPREQLTTADLKKVGDDYLNERRVAKLKEAWKGFSAMLSSRAERDSLAIGALERLGDAAGCTCLWACGAA